MSRFRHFVAAVALLSISLAAEGARGRATAHPAHGAPRVAPADVFSFAETQKIRVTHVRLDLSVDFEAKRLEGAATLVLTNPSATQQLVLDTADLEILGVTRNDGQPATWVLGQPTLRGTKLTIAVLPSTQSVTIRYRTDPQASGLYWNSAAQSFGRTYPYLYSQNEPDDARSWIPLQDTPSTRVTYDATIRVPAGMMAVMSASNPTATSPDGVYHFVMDQPIAPYLIALAVARLEFRSLGDRVGVYAEPELIDDAVHELSYMQEMLETAERIIAPYPWGRWDVALMPPTYVAGGMEHPRINFINPMSVVTFDKPATPFPTTLMAHELAHSWAGDQTTLATWSDVWLNEGITTYLTTRIIEAMSGPARAEHMLFSDRQSFEGYAAGTVAPQFTTLHRGWGSNDYPEQAFGSASYVKGGLFLHTMESVLGRQQLDAFLRDYFATYSFTWVDDRAFLGLLDTRVFAQRPDLASSLGANQWIYEPGLPSNVAAPTSSEIFRTVSAAAQAFSGGLPASQLNTSAWTSVETNLFLQLARGAISGRMSEVDAHFGFSSRQTAPTAWLTLAADRNYSPAFPAIERALMRGGSNGAIQAIYLALVRNPPLRPQARDIFDRAKDRYETSVRIYVQNLLASAQAGKPADPVRFGGHSHMEDQH
jgi:leukotriene-A4 hydrolase